MHCNICQRPCNARLPFNCASCARDILYQTRARLAHALLEQEAASSQVERNLNDSQNTSLKQPAPSSSIGEAPYASLVLESTNIQKAALKERIQLICDFSEDIRADISKTRGELGRRRASNARRKAELAATRQELARREAADVDPIVKTVGRIQSRWDILHTRTAESRLLLCKEAANLYGLRKQKKRGAKTKTGTYVVGGLPIFHLRDLNSKLNACSNY